MERAARRSTTQWRWRALQVSGDRYDAFQVSDGSTELVVGDVSGHDQEAAVMAQVRNVLRGIAPERPRLDHVQTLGPGATVVLHTDGLAERRGSSSTTGRAVADHCHEARPCWAGSATRCRPSSAGPSTTTSPCSQHGHPEDRPRPRKPDRRSNRRPAGPLTDGHPPRAGDQSWKSVLTLSSSHWSASARAVPSTCR